MASNYKLSQYNPVLTYEKFDVVYDRAGSYEYYYATQNVKTYQNPTGTFNFPITSWVREQDAATIRYTYSGNESLFAIGSIVRVTGLVNSSLNYTGMIIDAGSGWIKYSNQGFSESSSVSIGAINCDNPAWTTGFYFVPSYSSSLETKQSVITAQFGDGYSQRQKGALNNNMQTWKLAFNERSDKEAKAIFTFIEDHAGTDSVKILMPLNKFQNDPNLKYIIANPQISTTYFDLNNISLTATQVFDI